MSIVTTKTCTRCKAGLPLEAFSVNRARPDGLNSSCRECLNASKRARRTELVPLVPCSECAKPFRVWGKQLTCSPECALHRTRRLTHSPLLTSKVCEECVTQFVPPKKTSRFCSAKCKYRARHRQRYADPIHRAERTRYQSEYYALNRLTRLANGATWREANRERHRALSRAWWTAHRYSSPTSWRKRNLSKASAKERLRQSRIRSLTPFPLDHDLVLAKIAYWGGKCWMCGAEYRAMDHVKPIARGGLNIVANLRPVCTPCNSRKSAQWFGPSELTRFMRQ